MSIPRFSVPDGLDELREELPLLVKLIARTARWVHPDTFRSLPVWYPEMARGLPIYDAAWARVYTNTKRESKTTTDKIEANILAAKALRSALGASRKENWTACHIWGVDDARFQSTNRVVQDRRYYSCVGNMVWLPTPLKAFTDSVPSVKRMLRICAFHLYEWACEHPDVANEAEEVRSGAIPADYPKEWPSGDRNTLPPGTAPYTTQIAKAIEKRKGALRRMLGDESLLQYPRAAVRDTLAFWKIDL